MREGPRNTPLAVEPSTAADWDLGFIITDSDAGTVVQVFVVITMSDTLLFSAFVLVEAECIILRLSKISVLLLVTPNISVPRRSVCIAVKFCSGSS